MTTDAFSAGRAIPAWPPLRGCLFDLDGTLSDSIGTICRTARLAWAELGQTPSDDFIRSYIGTPLLDTGYALLGQERGHEYVEAYHRHYSVAGPERMLHPFAGVPEMLAALRERGIKTALCTSKLRPATLESVEMIGIEPLLDALICANDTTEHKPLPAPALEAARRLDLPVESCAFIGDSHFDLLCGRAAGMRAVGVTWGAGTRQALTDVQPDALVASVAELQELLLSWSAG